MTCFTDLPDDVVYEFLRGLPDFATLATAIKLSKNHTYDIFQEHKRIILYTVAINFLGVCLPHAFKLFRRTDDLEAMDTLSGGPLQDALLSLTWYERMELESSLHTTMTMEAIFSQTHKDRRSKESALTKSESTRFRVAMYRIWNLCAVGADAQDDDDFDPDAIDDENEWFAERIKPGLMHYSKSELSDVLGAAVFVHKLRELSNRAASALAGPIYPIYTLWHQMGLLIGTLGWPDAVLAHYLRPENSTYGAENSEIEWPAFISAVTAVSNVKKFDLDIPEMQEAAIRKTLLLDKVEGADDACSKCQIVYGVNLYGRSNWHLMRDDTSLAWLCGGLNGNLPRNRIEVDAIGAYFRRGCNATPRQNFDWAEYIEETFDIAIEEAQVDDIWDKDQWYCRDCLGHLLKTRFRKWWIAKKIEENLLFEPDCWYGYNCRTQQHKNAHAEKLNHLCEPTRGDILTPLQALVIPGPPVPLLPATATP